MVVVGIVAAAIVISIFSKWWVDGLVSGQELIVLSVIYGGLVFGLFAVGGLWPRIVVLTLLLASAGYAGYQLKNEGFRKYYWDKIKVYEQAIQADPRNLGARSMLAEAYYQLGDLDRAIAAMELAVQVSPGAVKESHLLRQWQDERDLRDSKTIVCRNCNSRNLWGSNLCRVCRAALIYPERGQVATGRHLEWRYIVAGGVWLVVVIVSFASMPPAQAGVVTACLTLAGVGWLLLSSSK